MVPAKEKAAASGIPNTVDSSHGMPLETFEEILSPQRASKEPSHRKEALGSELHPSGGGQAEEVAGIPNREEDGIQSDSQRQKGGKNHQRSPACKRSVSGTHPLRENLGESLTFPSLAVYESASGKHTSTFEIFWLLALDLRLKCSKRLRHFPVPAFPHSFTSSGEAGSVIGSFRIKTPAILHRRLQELAVSSLSTFIFIRMGTFNARFYVTFLLKV